MDEYAVASDEAGGNEVDDGFPSVAVEDKME